MASARLLQSNFAAGELSPRILASGDLERYGAGLALAQNLIVLPLGAVQRRSGSIWAEDPKDPTKPGRLLPFVRDAGDALAIVVSDLTIRFIETANYSYLLDGMSQIIELVCPWSDADLPHLFSWQSADVVWIGDRRGDAPVKVLKRVAGVWQALGDLTFKSGPFLPDEGVNLTWTAPTGAITLQAAGVVFTAGHVGALVNIRQNTGAPGVKRWIAGETVATDDFRYNAGRVYQAQLGGTTGNSSPIHDAGQVSDGGVFWNFRHDGLGVARITAVTDADTASALVENYIPFELAVSPYWGFQSFSNAAGWPRAATIHHERFVLGGAFVEPDTTHMSRVAGYGPDFADFKAGLGTGLVVDSDAVRRALNSGTVQQVLHYVSFERLYAFTSQGVHMLSGPSADEPISPAGASARERCNFAAAAEVAPVKTGDSILFATAGREEIREILLDSKETPNATVLVDHLAGRGIAELAFARSPVPVLWTRFDDGSLGSMTHEPLERVRAWAQHALGGAGVVTSAIVLPEPDGRESVWCYVKRTINGATRYGIEVIPAAWSKYREPIEYACALDAAGFFDFWNVDPLNRARVTVLDEDLYAVELETELNTFVVGDVGRRFAVRLAEPAKGFDPGADAAIARIDVVEFIDAKHVRGTLKTPGADALPGVWTKLWARMESELAVGARLEGASVDVLADGSAYLDAGVVTAGEAVLGEPVARGWVGLRAPFALKDLPIAQGSPIGTAFGPQKKVEKIWIVAEYATAGMVVVANGAETALVWRSADDPLDRPPVPVEGYHALLPKGAWSETGQIELRQDAPFPVLILGVVKEVVTQ